MTFAIVTVDMATTDVAGDAVEGAARGVLVVGAVDAAVLMVFLPRAQPVWTDTPKWLSNICIARYAIQMTFAVSP